MIPAEGSLTYRCNFKRPFSVLHLPIDCYWDNSEKVVPFYDADGSGTNEAAMQFTTLDIHLAGH
jgi:hypothetical protein